MKNFIFTLALFAFILLNSVQLSTESDGSRSRSRSSSKLPVPGSPGRRRSSVTSGVPSDYNKQIPHADDILLPLALEKYPLLAETLRKDWPAYAEYYYFVKTAIKWRLQEPNLPHKIYCPRGDYNSGIFVGISSIGKYLVTPFAHEGFEQLLLKAVTQTKIINWTQGVMFVVVSSRIITTIQSSIETLKQTMGIEVEGTLSGIVYFQSKEEAASNVRIPDGCYLNRLNQSHVPLIHSLWHYRNNENPETTMNFLKTRVRMNASLGLFSKENNELLSWMLQGHFGEGCSAQTIEKAKKKGYSSVVRRAFRDELADNGLDSFGFVFAGNVAGEAASRSTNYKEKQPVAYIQMKKLRSRF